MEWEVLGMVVFTMGKYNLWEMREMKRVLFGEGGVDGKMRKPQSNHSKMSVNKS